MRIVIEGSCPEAAAFRSALEQVGVEVAEQSEVALVVRSVRGQASLSVQKTGRELLVRDVHSSDCPAVAEAFALISADAISNLSDSVGEIEERTKNEKSEGKYSNHNLGIEPLSDRDGDSVGEIEERTKNEKAEGEYSSRNLALGVLLGFGSSDMSAFPGFAEVGLSADLAAYKGRIALWADSSQRFGDELNRRGVGARVELGREYVRNRYWLRPAVGGGISVFQVTPTNVGQIRANTVRVLPLLAVSLGVGRQISSSVSLRTELRGLWYPIADRYISELSPIGESPRSMVSLGIGLEWKVN